MDIIKEIINFLSDLIFFKRCWNKTANLLKKKKINIFLTYYGNYQNLLLIEVCRQK